MKTTPQQKIIGRELLAASQQLAEAKRIGNAPGALAQGISAALQSTARRKVADLIDLAAKYTPSTMMIAKDQDSTGDWGPIEAFGLSREQLPAIFKNAGLSEYEINLAIGDAAVAFNVLAQIGKIKRDSK